MLAILILQKNIQKELEKLIKNLLSILLIQKKLQKKIKSSLVIVIMMELSFPVQEKDFSKIEVKNNICIKVFGYKDEFFQFLFQIKNLKTQWVGLLLLIDDDKSHYV